MARYKSFEDRGVYVGFHTRMVELCRVRSPRDPDLDDYEALIPNWTGKEQMSSNDLVMPFSDVSNWASLSDRDNYLHDELEKRRTAMGGHLDPIMMREIRLQADAEAGREVDRISAERELEISKLDVQNAFLEILAMFGRTYADDVGAFELTNVNRMVLVALAAESQDSLRRLVRLVSTAVAKRASMTRELLQERLDVLSTFAAPICSLVTDDPTREVGFLSRQQGVMELLNRQVKQHAESRTIEIQDAARVIDMNIQVFLEYARTRSVMIKNALLTEGYYTFNDDYAKLLDMVAEERIKISYALDGWAAHASRWLALDEDDHEGRDAAVFFILKEMPNPTKNIEEEVASSLYANTDLSAMRGRVVRVMHSWADDSLDEALHARVMRAREAEEQKARDKARKDETPKEDEEDPVVSDLVKSAIAYKGESPF
ncbi:MAG: hypothetical protein RIM72_04315 [Alphaproteobacteria bacterium]